MKNLRCNHCGGTYGRDSIITGVDPDGNDVLSWYYFCDGCDDKFKDLGDENEVGG